MNESKRVTKKRFDVVASDCWTGCEGELYAPGCKCRKCGKTRFDHLSTGLSPAKSERSVEPALELFPKNKKSLLRIDCSVRVVITRGHGPGGPLDRDNLYGSCKKLRDEIARQILGREDDAESSTLAWEYRQKPGTGVMIEIYSEEK